MEDHVTSVSPWKEASHFDSNFTASSKLHFREDSLFLGKMDGCSTSYMG